MSAPDRLRPSHDSKTDLYDAALAVVQSHEGTARARRAAGEPSRGWLILLLLIGAAGAILLAVRPVWLAGPDAPPAETPAVAAASLRLALLQERQRVFEFSKLHGVLPGTLQDAGSPRADFRYDMTGLGGFTLTGTAGDSVIALRSSDALKDFLGTSLRRLTHRGAP